VSGSGLRTVLRHSFLARLHTRCTHNRVKPLMWANSHSSENAVDKAIYLSGWPDLNRRPLDPQIGPPQLSSVNHISLVSIVDR
jgi:hypothetical protein